MKQSDWRGLLIFDIIGHKIHITTRELREMLWHRYLILFVVLTSAILVLLDTHNYREIMSVAETIVLWTLCVVNIIALYVLLTASSIEVAKKYPKFFVYFPVIGIIAMTGNTFVVTYSVALLSGATFEVNTAVTHLPLNWALGLVFEAIFVVFVVPSILSQWRSTPPVVHAHSSAVVIAGKRFEPRDILMISSQDHYLEVVTRNDRVLLRGRLGDVVQQLAEADGIMPHRSYWVARTMVSQMSGNATRKILRLTSDVEVPIARGRVADVRQWLDVPCS